MVKTVKLTGSYYEIGKGWGATFKDEMNKVIEIELGVIAAFFQTDISTVISLGKSYLPAANSYDPDFIETLQGFADVAEIDFETYFAIRSVLEILFYTGQPEGMCTSFAVSGEATANGDTIIGQNIDWHPGLPLAVLEIEWPNGVKQLALSMGGIWEYPLTSPQMSPPYAIAATLTATPEEDPGSPAVPISIIMNKASRQKSLEEAMSVFKKARTNLASFLLADGTGSLQGIELGLRSFEPLTPVGDVLVHANHYVSKRLKEKDIFLQFVPDSPLRSKRMQELIDKNHGRITAEDMMGYLSDHDNYPKSICTHVDPASALPPSATLASVVMVPQRKIMYISIGNPCENRYVRYELSSQ